jgi:FecR protein
MKRRLAYQTCYVIAALWAMQQAASAAGIATVVDVVNEGYRTPPGEEERKAKPADDLVQEEALRTEAESVIQVKFIDGSELSVEAESEIVLSDYVFDPNGTSATGTINLNDGLFHFTSNGAPDQGVKLRTPVATIGVRGTEFLVHVDGDEATVIDILSGVVEATPVGAGKPITCEGGQSILIASGDQDAVCGDIGSFSTAAGPAGESAGHDTDSGQAGQDRPRKEKAPPAPDPGGEDGGEEGGEDGGEDGDHGEEGENGCDPDNPNNF